MKNKIVNWVKERLGIVTNWKCWYKWISNQLTILGTLVVSLAPDISAYIMMFVNAYGELPLGIQLAFPESLIRSIGIGVILLSIPARLTIQKKLPQE